MKPNSLIIAITLPGYCKGEAGMVEPLIEKGINYVHVRKPEWDEEEVAWWIEQVPASLHNRLVIHYHHQLTNKFRLGGIHQSTGHPIPGNTNLRTSISCHSIREMAENSKSFDYMFLSPIFDSISKEGYLRSIDHDELIRVLKHPTCETSKVVALGGIAQNTIEKARQMGFSGIALLGGLWVKNEDGSVNREKTIENIETINALWRS